MRCVNGDFDVFVNSVLFFEFADGESDPRILLGSLNDLAILRQVPVAVAINVESVAIEPSQVFVLAFMPKASRRYCGWLVYLGSLFGGATLANGVGLPSAAKASAKNNEIMQAAPQRL